MCLLTATGCHFIYALSDNETKNICLCIPHLYKHTYKYFCMLHLCLYQANMSSYWCLWLHIIFNNLCFCVCNRSSRKLRILMVTEKRENKPKLLSFIQCSRKEKPTEDERLKKTKFFILCSFLPTMPSRRKGIVEWKNHV